LIMRTTISKRYQAKRLRILKTKCLNSMCWAWDKKYTRHWIHQRKSTDQKKNHRKLGSRSTWKWCRSIHP
jgi:hypothetical protein